MIYIVTPSLDDFMAVCGVKKIPLTCNFIGMYTNPNVRWISNYKTLLRTNVIPTQVFYGFRFEEFNKEEQKKIKVEIQMRTIKR